MEVNFIHPPSSLSDIFGVRGEGRKASSLFAASDLEEWVWQGLSHATLTASAVGRGELWKVARFGGEQWRLLGMFF